MYVVGRLVRAFLPSYINPIQGGGGKFTSPYENLKFDPEGIFFSFSFFVTFNIFLFYVSCEKNEEKRIFFEDRGACRRTWKNLIFADFLLTSAKK